MALDINNLKRIVKVFDDSTADKIEIETEGLKIKMARNIPSGNFAAQNPVVQVQPQMQQPVAQQPIEAAATESTADNVASGLHEVKSPIVGTFYRAPSPESDSFVEVGSKVKAGDTLCIVEAMKLMNEIESDISGTVQEILVNNAEPVEYNQPIFLIKPE
jgi:acetyl-CoA carboxylase biotin carboxyl carrier protein